MRLFRTLQRELRPGLILVALLTAPLSAQRLPFGPTSFISAAGDTVPADTATLIAPENRHIKGSRAISIAVLRLRGTAGGTPLVYVSGGSGSGIAAARGPRFPFFLGLRALGDVVVFDIRGAGRSAPGLRCNVGLGLDLSQPLTRAALVTATRRVNGTCADSLRAQGFDLVGYNGREVVADIEALRQALGARKIRLFGTSTGTHLALEYVRRHGSKVESVFLAGTEGPGQTAHLPSDLDTTLTRVAAGTPNVPLLALITGVLESLDATPVSVDVRGRPVGLGGYDARVFIASTLGDRRQMGMLPQLFGAMRAGNFAPVAGLKLQAMNAPFQSPWESLHDCQAGTAPARRRLVAEQAGTAMLGYATLDFEDACDGWGVGRLESSYQTAVRSKVPALFISGSLDGRTPISNAEEVRSGFPNAAHLILEGASHGDDLFISSPAILEAVLSFARKPHREVRRVSIP
jgi:pimeloyl-ACP methyl ester carboxylesterase